MHHLHSLLEDTVDTFDVSSPTTRTFRAPTVDEALVDARTELGPDVEILEANRIRRGGVGGFFATDLGVEITVTTRSGAGSHDDRTTAADDRTPPRPARRDPHFRSFGELASQLASTQASTSSVGPASSAGADVDATVPLARHDLDDLDAVFDFTGGDPLGDDSFARHLERELSVDDSLDGAPATRVADFGDDFDGRDDERDTDVGSVPSDTATHHRLGADDALRARDPRSLDDVEDRFDAAAFASFVERELAADPAPTRRPVPESPERAVAAMPSAATNSNEVAERDRITQSTTPSPEPAGTARPATVVDSPARPVRRATTLRRPRPTESTVDRSVEASPAGVPDAVVAVAVPERSDTPAARAQAFERPAELVADAVNSLVGQLSHTAPVDGSRVHHLRRVQVTLTTAEGDVIQMAAELGAE